MKCPNCGSLNSDNAKFCKRCGNSLQHETLANQFNNDSNVNNVNEDKSKNILIICVAAVICVLIVAGAFIYVNYNNDNNSDVANVAPVDNNAPATATVTAEAEPDPVSNMKILGGSFSTGSSASSKTKAHIYVGSQYAGQQVKITTIWSRNGNNLNNGNILTKTVDSSGYVNFNSADAFSYYPDHAYVKLYDLSGNLVDTMEVYLNPTSGTQTF